MLWGVSESFLQMSLLAFEITMSATVHGTAQATVTIDVIHVNTLHTLYVNH